MSFINFLRLISITEMCTLIEGTLQAISETSYKFYNSKEKMCDEAKH